MTKIFLGLTALAFVALTPMAAQANTAVTDCALNVNTCVDGTNLVGKKIVTYGTNAGGASISDTNSAPSAGNKSVQTYEAARIPAGQGANAQMVPF